MVYSGGMLKLLQEREIQTIHQASMDILQQVGMRVENQKILGLLKEKGAKIDEEEYLAFLPEEIVLSAIEKAPSSVVLYSRDGKNDLELTEKNVYIGTGGTAVNVLDLETKERRESLSKDVVNTARLVENLPHIDFYVIPTYPHDYPKERADEVRFGKALAYTKKHIMGGVYTLQGIKKVIELGIEIAGSLKRLRERPFLSMITSIISPLTMEREYLTFMEYILKQGIPLVAPPAAIAGATAPLPLAGTLAQINAEALFGVVLSQLIEPGAKVLYGVVPTTMEMRTSTFRFSAIEMGMMNGAAAQLAQYYQLPIYNTAGVTDSKVPDTQAGYEKISNILLCALTGSNYIHDAAGLLDTGLSVAYEQYIIDNEIIGLVKRVLRGIEVDDERLALKDIAEAGPGGNFLTAVSTLTFMRTELYEDGLFDSRSFHHWKEGGALDTRERARLFAKEILEEKEKDCLLEPLMERIKTI